jgi:chromosome partitioning protein
MSKVKTAYSMTVRDFLSLPHLSSNKPEEQLKSKGIDPGSPFAAIPNDVMRAVLSDLGYDYDFRAITFSNLKGGVGKTTAVITTAARAAQYGFKTCILDIDSQASASLAFNAVADEDEPIFLDIWQNPKEFIPEALRQIDTNLFLIPSALENGLLDSHLINPAHQKKAVADTVHALKEEGFDLVLIDSPPSLGTAVISAICAADSIIIPLANDPFSLKGLELTIKEISSIRSTFGLPEPLVRAIFNRFDKREKLTIDSLKFLENRYPGIFLPTIIRTSSEFSQSLKRYETIFSSNRKSRAKTDFDNFVRTLLNLNGTLFKGKTI